MNGFALVGISLLITVALVLFWEWTQDRWRRFKEHRARKLRLRRSR